MQQLLHIVFVTNNYAPYSGGVVSSINALYDELVRQGHRVTIVTLDFLGSEHNDERVVIRIRCPVKFKYRHNHMAVPLFMYSQMYAVLKKINPDVIHVHHPFLLGWAAQKAAVRLGKPVVFTYHTLYEKYLHYFPLPQLLTKPVVMHYVHTFCKKVTQIIAPSTVVCSALIEEGIATPIRVVPSPVDQLFFNQQQYNQCTQLQKSARFKLLSVSRFTKEKNIPFLLDMFSRLDSSQYELTLIGFGSEYQALMHYAYQTLKLSPKDVRFIVRPAKHELPNYYRSSDLFVYASQTETQGLVMLEAMATGTPVVALVGPGQSDFIHNGDNGYLVDSMTAMTDVIEKIRINAHLHKKLSFGAQKTAQNYTPKILAQQILNVYKKLI